MIGPSLYLPFPSPDAATPSPPPATEPPSPLAPARQRAALAHQRAALAPSPSPPCLSRPSALHPSPTSSASIAGLAPRTRPLLQPRQSSPLCPSPHPQPHSWPLPLPTRGKPDPRRQARHSEEAKAVAMECVFGVVGRDFAVVVADTSAVQSILVHKNDEGKIMLLDSHMVLGASGEPGDRVQFTEYVQKNVHLYKFKNNMPLSTAATANFTRGELANTLRKAPPLPDEPVVIFIGILSSGNHFAERMGVRKTWMSAVQKSPNVVARFFVALHGRKEVDVELKKEAYFFGEIVFVPFLDNYDLVVLKTLAIWSMGFMFSAKYVMKCDDDTFVRLDSVISEVKKVPSDRSLYIGNMNFHQRPFREGKWAVTYEVS